MSEVVLCEDGMKIALESANGLWVVLREQPNERLIGRFEIGICELESTIRGAISYQATDGLGNSVRFEGSEGTLKVRFDGNENPSKQCRLDTDAVSAALKAIDVSV
jgi:hypothetical protein